MKIFIRYILFSVYLFYGNLYSQSHLQQSVFPERQNFNTAIVTNGYDTLSWSKFQNNDEWLIDYESFFPEDTVISHELGIALIFPPKYFVSRNTNNLIELSIKLDSTISEVLTITSETISFDSLAIEHEFYHNSDGSWSFGAQDGSMGAFEIIGETFHCLYNNHLVRLYEENGPYIGMGGSEIEFYFVINTFNNHTLSFSNHSLSPFELFFILRNIRLLQ